MHLRTGKLVRTKIPALLKERPLPLKGSKLRDALHNKLDEESAELHDALISGRPRHVIEEAADVYEVALAMVEVMGGSEKDLQNVIKSKRKAKGKLLVKQGKGRKAILFGMWREAK
jgi:predicted house-cleaning noncanonical NTP pyrophosphatase (MazG superfamily)